MDYSPPGSSVHGFLQARVLEWVAIPFSRGSSNPWMEPASPVSPTLQADSLLSEPPGNPLNEYLIQLSAHNIFSTYALLLTPFCRCKMQGKKKEHFSSETADEITSPGN